MDNASAVFGIDYPILRVRLYISDFKVILPIILYIFISDIANWYDTLRYSVFLYYNETHQHNLYYLVLLSFSWVGMWAAVNSM